MTGVTSRSQNARSRSRIAALVVGQLLVEQVEVRHAPECATVSGMDLRSAVEAGWEHQLELLRALVRAPSTLGNERAAQEIVADELRVDRPGAATVGRRRGAARAPRRR